MSSFARKAVFLNSFLCLLGLAPIALAQTYEAPLQLNIPAGSLANGLDRLGDESGVQIMYEPSLTKGITVAAIDGTLTVNEALGKLLAQTGLKADRVNKKTVVLRRVDATDTPTSRKTHRDDSTLDGVSDDASAGASEVVVSAQKRGEERLQDTPIPISVVNTDALAETGQVKLRDFYMSVPGLSVTPDIISQQEIAIRGISNSELAPTVAVLVDDVPYGSATASIGNYIPDIDPSDLARIEVLRGPQGTLYGANAMGGLVKYVTKDPSTEGFSGRIEASTNDVSNGAEPGFSLRGSANVPVSDDFAVRASAFTRQDAGYIDNVVQNIKGINEAEAFGARLAALWRPSANLYLKFSALYQNIRQNGISEIDSSNSAYYSSASAFPSSLAARLFPPMGDLQQNYVPGVDRSSSVSQAYALSLKDKFGAVDFASNTAYQNVHTVTPFDYTFIFGPTFIANNYAETGAPLSTETNLHRLSEEIRLSGSIGSRLEWLVGGFYARENASPQTRQYLYEADLATGEPSATFFHQEIGDTYSEYAGFGSLTYHFTDDFDVQAGVRQSHTHESNIDVVTGPYVVIVDGESPPGAPVITHGSDSSHAFTYLFTPEYKLSHDLMVYARLASGFRPGGVNPATPGVPPEYAPDKTYNYELGLKGEFLDHRLSLDTSVYYIDWKNIQISVVKGLLYYTGNAGAAKSEGVEVSFSASPLTGLTISGWIDYDHAVLTADLPPYSVAYGVAGNELPTTPEYSAQLSLQQRFPLFGKSTGSLAAVANYQGDRVGLFQSCPSPTATGACPVSPPRQYYPAYTRTDLRANVEYGAWTSSLYVNNIANVRGLTSGGLGYYVPYAFNVIQPRTVGLTVIKTF